jgi:hypothetical protein
MHQHDYYDEQLHLYFQIEHNRSKVSPLQKSPNLQPSPMPFIFGNGVILTYHDGKAVVTMSDDTPLWTKKLALVLVNYPCHVKMYIQMQTTLVKGRVNYLSL